MTHGSLYSGIGGWLLAARWAGIENIFTCEIDNFCNKVLDKHFPDTDRHYDIKETNFKSYAGRIDILSTSDPCQPFSFAGKRGGKADDRYLWPQTIRVIREIKPTYVVFENVPGLLSMEDGKTFEGILLSMEEEGYTVEPIIIPACAVGAWHRRERLWVLCYRRQTDSHNGRIIDGGNKEFQKGQQHRGWGESFGKHSPLHEIIPNHDNARDRTSWSGTNKEGEEKKQEWGNESQPESCRYDWWTSEPNVDRMVYGLSKKLDKVRKTRLRGLGNSIVPQIAYIIFEAIKESNNLIK